MTKPCELAEEEAVRQIKRHIRTLRSHLSAARAGDPDGIHDLRVASRRLRSALREARPAFGAAQPKRMAKQVQKITRWLGKARELDVSILLLDRHRSRLRGAPRHAATHVIRHMRSLRKAASPEVMEAADFVESPEFAQALMSLFEARHPAVSCHLMHAKRSISARHKRLQAACRAWEKSHREDDLHQVRICFKKLRYTCEFYERLHPAVMKKTLAELKQAQEALGQWNDYRILRDYVAAAAPSAPPRAAGGFSALTVLLEEAIAARLLAFSQAAPDFLTPRHGKALSPPPHEAALHCEKCPHVES